MKIKNIERLVRLTGRIQLLDGADNLWIGNGYAIAPVWDFKRIADEQAAALLNLTEKERDKFRIERGAIDEAALTDPGPDEELLGEPLIGATVQEIAYTVYDAPSGAVWIRDAWLKPFLSEDKRARLALRQTEFGPRVAVLRGFFLVGIIAPAPVGGELCRTLETLYVRTSQLLEFGPETDMRAIKGGLS